MVGFARKPLCLTDTVADINKPADLGAVAVKTLSAALKMQSSSGTLAQKEPFRIFYTFKGTFPLF